MSFKDISNFGSGGHLFSKAEWFVQYILEIFCGIIDFEPVVKMSFKDIFISGS